MDLVIMAAGMGSRFGGLKQIEPINDNGEFIIDYSIYDAIKAGFDKVIFVIKEENYEIFRETVGKRVEKRIDVEYVFQRLEDIPDGYEVPEGRVKPWGTAHAILACKYAVKNNFAIINADDFYGYDAFKVTADFLSHNKDMSSYSLAGYKVKNTLTENGSVKRGVCESKHGYLRNIVESSIEQTPNGIIASPLDGSESFEVDGDQIVSMNMFGFTPALFNYLEKRFVFFMEKVKTSKNPQKEEFLIPDIVAEQIHKGNASVKILNTSAVWHGVTYKEDKEGVVNAIKELTEKGEYPKNLWGEPLKPISPDEA